MVSPGQTHYQVLGVSPAASAREIRTAFKQRARELHPDRHPDRQEWATQQFRAVLEAFDVLKDPAKRRAYDASLRDAGSSRQTSSARDDKHIELAAVERLYFDGRLTDAYREVRSLCSRFPGDSQCQELRAAVALTLGTHRLAGGELDDAERYLLEAQSVTRAPGTQARVRAALDSLAAARSAGAGRSWRRLAYSGAIVIVLAAGASLMVRFWPSRSAEPPPAVFSPEPATAPKPDTRPRSQRGPRRSAPTAAPSSQEGPAPEAPTVVAGPSVTVRVMSRGAVPEKLRGANPVYPEPAVAAGVQGTVLVEVTIRSDGRVAATNVLQSIPGLDDAVTGAVGRWVYAPRATLGADVPLTLMLAVDFRL